MPTLPSPPGFEWRPGGTTRIEADNAFSDMRQSREYSNSLANTRRGPGDTLASRNAIGPTTIAVSEIDTWCNGARAGEGLCRKRATHLLGFNPNGTHGRGHT
jgi:hypothetical protein